MEPLQSHEGDDGRNDEGKFEAVSKNIEMNWTRNKKK